MSSQNQMPEEQEEPLAPRVRRPPPEFQAFFNVPLVPTRHDARDSGDESYGTEIDEGESDGGGGSGMDADEPENTPAVPAGGEGAGDTGMPGSDPPENTPAVPGAGEGADDTDMPGGDPPENTPAVPGGGAGADGGQDADLAVVPALVVTEDFYNAGDIAEEVEGLDVEWDETYSVLLTGLETLVREVFEFENQQYLLVYKVIDVYKQKSVPFFDQLSFDTALEDAKPFVMKWMDADQAMYIPQNKLIQLIPDVRDCLADFTNRLNEEVRRIMVSIEREGDVAAPVLQDLLAQTTSLDVKKRSCINQNRQAYLALRDANLRRSYEHAREGGFKAAYENYVKAMQAREAIAAGRVVSDARFLTISVRGDAKKPGGFVPEGTGETSRNEVDDGEEEYMGDDEMNDKNNVLYAWSVVARTQTKFYSYNDERKFRKWALDSADDVEKAMLLLGHAMPGEGQYLDLSIETLAELWFAHMYGTSTEWDKAADEATALDGRDMDRTAYMLLETNDRNRREERANENARQGEPAKNTTRQYDRYGPEKPPKKKQKKTGLEGSGSKEQAEEEDEEDEGPDEGEDHRRGIRLYGGRGGGLEGNDGGGGGGGNAGRGGSSADRGSASGGGGGRASGGGGKGGKAGSGAPPAGGSSADRGSASGGGGGRASDGGGGKGGKASSGGSAAGGSSAGRASDGGGGGGGKGSSGGSPAGGSSADRAPASGGGRGRASDGGGSSARATPKVFKPELPKVGSIISDNANEPDFLHTYRLPVVTREEYLMPSSSQVEHEADMRERASNYEPQAGPIGEVCLPTQNRVQNVNMIVRKGYYDECIAETEAQLTELKLLLNAETSGPKTQQTLRWNIDQLQKRWWNALRQRTINKHKLSGSTLKAKENSEIEQNAERYLYLDEFRESLEREAAGIRDTEAGVAEDNETARDLADKGQCTIREVEGDAA